MHTSHPLVSVADCGSSPGRVTRAYAFLIAWLLGFSPLLSLPARGQPLPALDVDLRQTSVSGLSAGAFMAVQFQVAYASVVVGAGVVAGGPYYCARNDAVVAATKCSCTGAPLLHCAVSADSANIPDLLRTTRAVHANGLIDDPAAIAGQRILTISGARDDKVPSPIVDQLNAYYRALNASPASVSLTNAGHTMPTKNSGKRCDLSDDPYIGKCGYDAAAAILTHIYGADTGKRAQPRGQFRRFDQKPYVPQDWQGLPLWRTGLDSTGWLYVPRSCAQGERCRVHIALHGCKQGQEFGSGFVRQTGYARWADGNKVVVLFPQAGTIPWLNPFGCWDWWGYTDGNYANQMSVQMRAIRAMLDDLGAPRPTRIGKH